ncbi:MAG: chemotaxis protein CheX, partial [bacterium]
MSEEGNTLQDAMYDAAANTLENMAFMEVIPQRNRRDEQKYFSRLEILSPVTGSLTLITSVKLATDLAEELQEPEPGTLDEAMIRDTLSELINTIAGGMMRRLTPENETFRLGLPEAFTEGEVDLKEPFELARFTI